MSHEVRNQENSPKEEAVEQAAEEEALEERAVEVVDEEGAPAPQPTEELQEAKTYVLQHGPVRIQAIPQVVGSGETRWRLWVFLQGVQGPILQDVGLSDAAAADLGLPEHVQERVNSAIEEARQSLQLPRSLRGASRDTSSWDELEHALED